jgi:hypothetical protein
MMSHEAVVPVALAPATSRPVMEWRMLSPDSSVPDVTHIKSCEGKSLQINLRRNLLSKGQETQSK